MKSEMLVLGAWWLELGALTAYLPCLVACSLFSLAQDTVICICVKNALSQRPNKYPKAFSLPSNWQELEVFFFCFYVMLLWSLGTMWLPQKEKEKDLLRLSSGMNLA